MSILIRTFRGHLKKCKVGGYSSCGKCIPKGSEKFIHMEMGKKTTEIIQMKPVNEPQRKDEDFLTYFSTANKNIEDNHCKNKHKTCP